MWQTSNDLSSSIGLRAECVSTVTVPVQDRHGKWSYDHFLASGHDGETVSGHNKLDSAVVSFRSIEMSNMDPTERTGKVGNRTMRILHGTVLCAPRNERRTERTSDPFRVYWYPK